MEFLMGLDWALILGVALAMSEALALIPAVKSNGIFEMVYNLLKKFKK